MCMEQLYLSCTATATAFVRLFYFWFRFWFHFWFRFWFRFWLYAMADGLWYGLNVCINPLESEIGEKFPVYEYDCV